MVEVVRPVNLKSRVDTDYIDSVAELVSHRTVRPKCRRIYRSIEAGYVLTVLGRQAQGKQRQLRPGLARFGCQVPTQDGYG